MTLSELPKAYVVTILQHIAMLLLQACNGDLEQAQIAAAATLAGYEPRTEHEFRLAARIICFSLQAGAALAQAADPAMPLPRTLRLRSGAVSLTREAAKAERALEKLRSVAGLSGDQQPEARPEPASTEPEPEEAPAAEEKRKIAAYAKAHGLSWTKAYEQRQREKRLAERQVRDAQRAAAVLAGNVAPNRHAL